MSYATIDLTPEERKTAELPKTRCTETLRQDAERMAGQYGMTLCEFIRRAVEHAVEEAKIRVG